MFCDRFGVWADWDAPYLTLQPEYEAAQLRVTHFIILVLSKKHIVSSEAFQKQKREHAGKLVGW